MTGLALGWLGGLVVAMVLSVAITEACHLDAGWAFALGLLLGIVCTFAGGCVGVRR